MNNNRNTVIANNRVESQNLYFFEDDFEEDDLIGCEMFASAVDYAKERIGRYPSLSSDELGSLNELI